MFAFALALVVARAPNVEAKFTYRTRGATVGAVLTEVSRLTRVSLETTPATAREIVLVDVKDAKLSDFMPRLARVATGEWKAEGNGFRLTRSDAFARRSRQEEYAATAQRLTAALEKRRAGLGAFGGAEADALAARAVATLQGRKAANDGSYFRTMETLNAESPTGRFAVRALGAIGGTALATLQPLERRVYAVRPNRVQTALPFDLRPMLDQYLKEQAAYGAALSKRLDAKDLAGQMSGALQAGTGEAPSRVLFAVARAENQEGVRIRVIFINREERITREAMASIDLEAVPWADSSGADAPLDLAPTSKAFVEMVRALQRNQALKPEGDLLKELENPEQFDPVSFVTPDGLHAVADGGNVVAQVEDMALLSAATVTADEKGVLGRRRFRGWLERGHDLREENGWLVVTPKRAWDAREIRIDRAHMGRFFRTARKQGGTNLAQLAEYALGAPRRYAESLSWVYAFFLQPQVNASITMDNLEFLRIYGALDTRQRRVLQSTTPIAIGELPAAARAELTQLAFREGAPLQYTVMGEDRQEGRPLGHEPTEAMPDGLPGTGQLLGRLVAEEAVIGMVEAGRQGANAYEPMRAWDLAWNLALNESNPHPNDMKQYSKYRIGRIGKLEMAVKFTEMLGCERSLMQTEFLETTPWVEFGGLPAAFREAVTKHLPEAREKVAEMRKREAGGKVPPPL